ncbi:hypothetical protein B0H10DRAFT_2446622 [Mycena sp. CBHHK59/15]|nr:hypothetical protein B0H10DRAFT_2446622 [Mycena sp. CBHHK59/15]
MARKMSSPPPMSSFNAFGFFALAGGRRLATQAAGSTYPVYHCHYHTALKSPTSLLNLSTVNSDDSIDIEYEHLAANLRVYSGSGDAPLPDNTVAFVIAKVFAATGKTIELDALFVAPLPGDVDDEHYQDNIPSLPVFIYAVGHIPANHSAQTLTDGSKTFTMTVGDYVGGGPKNSALQCMYPPTKRWVNVPVPRSLSCTQLLGYCYGFSDSGLFRMAIEHVTLSLGPHGLTQSPTTVSTNTDSVTSSQTPARRKKYVAIGSTSTPTTSAAGSSSLAQASTAQSLSTAGAGPSSSSSHETRSKKRRALSPSHSPPPENDNDDDTVVETPTKWKGKKKAKQ